MPRSLTLTPFTRLPEDPPVDVLFVSPWEVSTDDDGGSPSHWDYKVDLYFRRDLEINVPLLREYCGLPAGAKVGAFGEWGTDLTGYARGRGEMHDLALGTEEKVTLPVRLPVHGGETGGTLSVHTFIILTEAGNHGPDGPWMPGSILWETVEKYPLEQPGSRLPVCAVDFSEYLNEFHHPRAAWVVRLFSEGLERPASDGMQIYVNTKHALFDLLTQDNLSGEANLARQMMYFDVGRQLVTRALNEELFCDPEYTFPEASMGKSLRGRVRLLFPGLSLREVRALHKEDKQHFEAIIQGKLLKTLML